MWARYPCTDEGDADKHSSSCVLTEFISPVLETTQRQMDGLLSQPPYKCYLPEVASVGDCLKICPWVASRVVLTEFISQNVFIDEF